MSEPKDPNDPLEMPNEEPTQAGARRAAAPPSITPEIEDRDFEPDALLESLTEDPFPTSSPPRTPPPGPKLHEPAQRLHSQDDVTVVGQEIGQLLAASLADSILPGAHPTAPAPPPEVTVVGRGLDELLAQAAAADSMPPPPVAPAARPPAAPPRPAMPPRPTVPRPDRAPGSAPVSHSGSAASSSPSTSARPVSDFNELDHFFDDHSEDDSEDEETRILRVDSEEETNEQTVRRLPNNSANPPFPERSFQPESFVPPAAFLADSLSPDRIFHEAATPMPARPDEAARAEVPLAPRVPAVRAEFESEAPTGQLTPAIDSSLLRAPPMPSLDGAQAASRTAHRQAPAEPVATTDPTDPRARKDWIARAEWFEAEARAAADPETKSRTLLVASELWAIVGDLSRAREVATEAAASRSMTMAARQVRWLAALDHDYQSVAATLDVEARSASTSDARQHASYLGAEVQRLVLDDAAQAKKKHEASARAQGSDPRSSLIKLAAELASSSAPPKFKWPELEEVEPLARATEQLSYLRGATEAPAPVHISALVRARRALARGDRKGAADAVLQLSEMEGLDVAGRLLAASLLAQDQATRAEAIELLKPLLNSECGESACRAVAARALELGDQHALALSLETDSRAFSAADRVVLRALSPDQGSAGDPIRELGNTEAGRPLATAAVLASPHREDDEIRAGALEARACLALGRRIARGGPGDLLWLRPALGAFAEPDPRHPLVRTLGLELALAIGSAQAVAAALAEWPCSDHEPLAQRDRELLCALVHEIGGENQPARAAYERALAADATCEPAVRALSVGASDEGAAELLERLGEAETSGSAAALHLTEAALRRGSEDSSAFHSTLERAVEADPKLVLPYRLGEHLARLRGDAERLLGWLRARRGTLNDPLELALDLVREALLVAESDLDAAAALLREASEARPSDIAIAELYERVAPSAEFSRAAVRESAAGGANGVARQRLLLEAALEYERSADRQGAVRAARAAMEADGSELSRIILERVVLGTTDSTRLAEELISRAKATDDAGEQRELYEQLSEIDAARGNGSSALLWQSAILERSPRQLSALRRLEHTYLRSDRREDLEPVLTALAEALTGADAAAAARLAARLRLTTGSWAGVRRLAELAVRADPNALWALRTLSAHARAAEDFEASLGVERRLFELVSRPLDKATLALRAGEAAAQLERWDEAQALLEHALDQSPEHLVALATLAEVLERRGEPAAAARALEAVAQASRVSAHAVTAWYDAGVLWLDRAEDAERGRTALSRAVSLDLGHEDAVSRLQAVYVARGDRQRLAELLEKRLERTSDPEERIALEVARGRALAEIGEPAAAKAALAAALDANPDHFEALEAFAGLCLGEGDWLGAEQAFIRLARQAPDAQRQAQIYGKLGELYDVALPNPERAELAYQEVLKRAPNDAATVDRLIAVYGRLGAPEKAVLLAGELLERAESAEDRRERTVRLAAVLEQVAGNKKQAELTLEKARREWPHDASVLRALAELYTRSGEQRSAQLVLDRAAMDARRALGTGRFEPALFETLATVADLRGSPDGAAVAHATLAALAGDEMPVRGGGPSAGEARLDEVLAPDLLGPLLRGFLVKTGDLLDKAYPVDLRALRASPWAASDFSRHVEEVAQAFGLSGIELYTSPILGHVCLPGGSAPPTLVFGQGLAESGDEAARFCLLIRALTVLKARASALARTAPIDLGPMLGGLLAIFAPDFSPQGIDPKKLNEARAKIQETLTSPQEDDIARLALEVSGSIGNRASQLATALYQWGNRTALLATGDPLAILRALAVSGGSPSGPPPAGPDRVRWIVRNAEARDLMIFSVSEQYTEGRRRLGLAPR